MSALCYFGISLQHMWSELSQSLPGKDVKGINLISSFFSYCRLKLVAKRKGVRNLFVFIIFSLISTEKETGTNCSSFFSFVYVYLYSFKVSYFFF